MLDQIEEAEFLRDVFKRPDSAATLWISIHPFGSTAHRWAEENPWSDLPNPPPVVKVPLSAFQCGCGECWFCARGNA